MFCFAISAMETLGAISAANDAENCDEGGVRREDFGALQHGCVSASEFLLDFLVPICFLFDCDVCWFWFFVGASIIGEDAS